MRELEVLALVAGGLHNQEIASQLVISTGTVNRHLENIYAKMEVKNRAEAVVQAAREGLIPPTDGAGAASMPVPAYLKR